MCIHQKSGVQSALVPENNEKVVGSSLILQNNDLVPTCLSAVDYFVSFRASEYELLGSHPPCLHVWRTLAF